DYYGYCLVAEGKGEIYVEADLKPWDVAPMKILVEEAGGRLTDFAGRPNIYEGTVVGTNGHLHEGTLGLLRPAPGRAGSPQQGAAPAELADRALLGGPKAIGEAREVGDDLRLAPAGVATP